MVLGLNECESTKNPGKFLENIVGLRMLHCWYWVGFFLVNVYEAMVKKSFLNVKKINHFLFEEKMFNLKISVEKT